MQKTKKQVFSGVFSTILTILLTVLSAMLIYTTVSTARGKTVTLFGKSVFRVVTGSMEPSIHVGDCIIVEKTNPDMLKVGDIIAFYSSQPDIQGLAVTHRIVGFDRNLNIITKGDANAVNDSYTVTPEQIIGKYTGKAGIFKWLYSFGDMRKAVLLAVMIPMTVISFLELKSVVKAGRELKEESEEEMYSRLMREAIEKEKKRLAEENYSPENEVKDK